MNLKVIKGAHQIGGSITTIETASTKIVIDFGEDLCSASNTAENERKLVSEIDDAGAVFITHSHQDHIGLVNRIPKDIPVYMEEMSRRILEVGSDFHINEPLKRPVNTFHLTKEKPTQPIEVGDMTITPYIVDHSSYNSCMFLIEAEGKRILHTGDYRNHGRKGKLFLPTLKSIGHIDCLITEGTTLSRKDQNIYKTEQELELIAKNLFAKYDQVFVLSSSTNLDRIVTFYKARGDKKVVFDTFTQAVTTAVNFKITSKSPDVFVWHPIAYRKNKTREFQETYMNNTYDYKFLPNYIMFIKQSMLPDLYKLKKENMMKKACLVYSMWNGYIEKEPKLASMIEKAKKMGLDFYELHTSGHADTKAMKQMDEYLKPDKTIIIHTENEDYTNLPFSNVYPIEDGETLEI